MSQTPIRRYAMLHVGSTSMSMTIIEYESLESMRVVDYVSRAVTFGEELFQTQRLSFETIEEICKVLKGYKQLMADYGVTEAKLYGTTVIREAKNRRIILEQIFIHTGFRVEVIDMPKEVYYKYFALYYHMQKILFTSPASHLCLWILPRAGWASRFGRAPRSSCNTISTLGLCGLSNPLIAINKRQLLFLKRWPNT